MPMAVELPKVKIYHQGAYFGIPENKFAFLTILDGNSSLYRKNVLATIRAFKKAFRDNSQVVLVIKAMNIPYITKYWKLIESQILGDDRIIFIPKTLSKIDLLGLHKVCDCFVSLHRAEGFGRNIAEAMLMEKPVIVSEYSGNLDFTNEKTAFLVDGSLVDVGKNEYPYYEFQKWFDPDIDLAANALRQCYDDVTIRALKAKEGKKIIEKLYSYEAVGREYSRHLEKIQNNYC
jgi:glycosyltransferase involved in cell wall biosynthesis